MNKILTTILIALFAFLVWFPISPLNTIFNLSYYKQVSGYVFDCADGQRISNANVILSGTGWAWNDGPIWDKEYISSVPSVQGGNFNLKYHIGNKLFVEKEGYLKATADIPPNEDIKIGVVKRTNENKNELTTYDCKLQSECLKTKVVNGIEGSWNSCSNPELGSE